jgi:hypothetical protein
MTGERRRNCVNPVQRLAQEIVEEWLSDPVYSPGFCAGATSTFEAIPARV